MGDFLYLYDMEKFYIYLHIRKSDNVIFYVGKGHDNRAWSKRSRNNHWKNTVKNHGLEVKLIAENISEEKAFELEKTLIKFYGRKDLGLGTLVNWTDGGEGSSGKIVSHGTKEKISLKAKERYDNGFKSSNGFMVNNEQSNNIKEKISLKAKERYDNGYINPMTNKKHSDKVKEDHSQRMKGRYLGDKNPRSRMVLNLLTGVYYTTAKECAKLYSINYSGFTEMLKGTKPNTTNFIYV
jgi:hypothetical protein